MADATRSHEVETKKQTLAPTLEDGTLQTADDGEPNPPTGAASSITISSEQFDRVMSAVKRMNAEGMQKQARELMDTFLSTVNNDVSTIMTPPPSQVNSGARGGIGEIVESRRWVHAHSRLEVLGVDERIFFFGRHCWGHGESVVPQQVDVIIR